MEKTKKVKNGMHREKQKYLCKFCGRNYTGAKNGYTEKINWVKKSANEIMENKKIVSTKTDIL